MTLPRSQRQARSSRPAKLAKLWKCPRCGAKLIARNLSHACGAYSTEKFLEGSTDVARALFGRFERMVAKCGPYTLAPAKTRVAFMAEVRFASVNRIGQDYIDVHFVLPRTMVSPRFRRVDHVGKLYVHCLRLRDRREFDHELASWLRRSYVEYGRRGWLGDKRRNEASTRARSRQTLTPAR